MIAPAWYMLAKFYEGESPTRPWILQEPTYTSAVALLEQDQHLRRELIRHYDLHMELVELKHQRMRLESQGLKQADYLDEINQLIWTKIPVLDKAQRDYEMYRRLVAFDIPYLKSVNY